MNTADLILTAMCCLQTSVRGAFTDTGIPAPEHVFLTDQAETPFCLSHSFGTVRYLGAGPYSLNGLPSDCLKGYNEKFEIIVGVCAPPPPAVLAARGVTCTPDELYGECPPCGSALEINPPAEGGSCVLPEIKDGGFDWPDNYKNVWSLTSFTGYLLIQRFILRSNFLKIFCECFDSCNQSIKGKAKFSVESVEPWCDGQFQGTRMVVEGNLA